MRNIWLLPDRKQTGCVQALENEKTYDLHMLINLKDLPYSFVLGIPEEVYRSKKGESFLFAQFAFLRNGLSVFCLSAPAGKDISGRLVSISNLQILEKGEEPYLQFVIPQVISEENKKVINIISSSSKNTELEPFNSVSKMLRAVKEIKWAYSFSSELLVTAKYKPDWMPSKKRLGLYDIKYKKNILLICLFILCILSFFLLL